MGAFDYAEFQALAKELIEETGRTVTLRRHNRTPVDASKPWRGSNPRETPADTATVVALFTDTISSRYLSSTVQREGNEEGVQELMLVATSSAPGKTLEDFDECLDGTELLHIKALNILRPGDEQIFVAFKIVKRELFE